MGIVAPGSCKFASCYELDPAEPTRRPCVSRAGLEDRHARAGDRGDGVHVIGGRVALRSLMITRGAIAVGTMLSGSLSIAQTVPGVAPAAVASAVAGVCRPTFMRDGQPSQTGTSFVLHAPAFTSSDVLIGVHHLFGMATATTTGMPWQDVPRRVRSATCRSLDGARHWRTAAAVAIPGVHAFWRGRDIKDIAILPVVSGPSSTLDLSPRPAAPGDVVFVLAQVDHPFPTDGYVHRAHVIFSSGSLAFVYDDPGFRASNTSGSPVVSEEGKVVGVNVAAGRLPNGALLGVADDLATLETALAAAPAP